MEEEQTRSQWLNGLSMLEDEDSRAALTSLKHQRAKSLYKSCFWEPLSAYQEIFRFKVLNRPHRWVWERCGVTQKTQLTLFSLAHATNSAR